MDACVSLACLLVSTLWVVYIKGKRASKLLLPPGPKGLPIVGNWFQLPTETPWETYTEWSKIYGEVVHVKDFARHVIILNSWKSAYELLEKRSNIYSDRPQYVMLHDLLGFRGATPFIPYGDMWRRHRTLYNRQMHKGALSQFESLQYEAVNELVRSLRASPSNFAKHIRHMAASIVVRFTYGHKLQPNNDPILKDTGEITKLFSKAMRPGAYLVDNFPILKYVPTWFPGAKFKKIAAVARRRAERVHDMTFQSVKKQLKIGNENFSFVARSLSELGKDDESDPNVEAVRYVARGILNAGQFTITRTLLAFILAMAIYPDCMKKAQDELDRVVGNGRLPRFTDRPALPYLTAVLKEVLRWFPVSPTSIPHATTAEDVYEGYRIPAGSTVIPNTWKILHDPESYSNPYTFRPERFLPEQNAGIAERDPGIGSFGYGRRICPGRNLAEATLWLTMATLLCTFEWSQPMDKQGQRLDYIRAIQPPQGVPHGVPQDFTVQFTPRL